MGGSPDRDNNANNNVVTSTTAAVPETTVTTSASTPTAGPERPVATSVAVTTVVPVPNETPPPSVLAGHSETVKDTDNGFALVTTVAGVALALRASRGIRRATKNYIKSVN